jgi:hypothetical protein
MPEPTVPPSLEVRREMASANLHALPAESYDDICEAFLAQLSLIRDRLGPDGEELCEVLYSRSVRMVLAANRSG